MNAFKCIAVTCVLIGYSSAVAGQDGDIRQAYKREFAFLAAEKASLQGRLQTQAKEMQQKTGAAKAEIDALQARMLQATIDGDQLTQTLSDVERAAEGTDSGADAMNQLLESVGATLQTLNITVPEQAETPEGDAAAAHAADTAMLGKLLQLSTTALDKVGSVHKEPGAFFAADGTRVEGDIIHVGDVARFGVAGQQVGALAPAGGGHLKVWPEATNKDAILALAAGKQPQQLDMFLYESLEKPVEEPEAKDVLTATNEGGTIAWVIAGVGLLVLAMILARVLILTRLAANTERLVDAISPAVRQGNIEQALQICRKSQSAAGRVLRATLQNLHRSREHLEDIISESILHETPQLDRFGSTILVIATVSPLLGLLGTVSGMITTFNVITEVGTGNPKLLSGGISEALVATQYGLVVAIPALMFGSLLNGWAERIKDDMDKAALRVTNLAHGVRVSQLREDSDEGGAAAGAAASPATA